jgi:hypothetical protein
MIDRESLEVRLRGWAQEYGGGRYENIGYPSSNALQTLIEHQGFMPNSAGFVPIPIRSAADEVEAAVNAMERSGWYRQGRVVRCDYFLPHAAMESRLKNLAKAGVSLSRASYYDHLAQAKAYLAGALSGAKAA